VRTYIAEKLREFLAEEDFLDAIPGYLLPDSASQARVVIVLDRLKALATLD
jgi:hypothetical protein